MPRPGILIPFKNLSGAELLLTVLRSLCPDAVVVACIDEGEYAGRFADRQFCHALLKKAGPINAIAHVWNELADIAYKMGADYTILLGDDIEILDGIRSSLFQELNREFETNEHDIIVAKEQRGPGWPSFPAVSRQHWERFGALFPDNFINQEADPFLFELYRRFGRAKFLSKPCLLNHIGGVRGGLVVDDVNPRYKPNNSLQWEGLLDLWSAELAPFYTRKITLDIIIPSMRYVKNLEQIRRITELTSPTEIDHRVVILLDGPVTCTKTWESWRAFELESRDLCVVVRVPHRAHRSPTSIQSSRLNLLPLTSNVLRRILSTSVMGRPSSPDLQRQCHCQ